MTVKSPIALVTGASSGIGRETALRMAESGYRVIAAARRMDRLEKLAGKRQGIEPVAVDLADPGDTARFCQMIEQQSEPVGVLVNNAGYAVRGAIEDVPLEAVRRIFEVNLLSLIQVTRACLPGMREQRQGTIINLSSLVGKVTFPLGGIYAASKHAVEAVTDALRLELRPLGIKVVAIRPGVIATEFQDTANEISGDPLARTHEDYRPIYQAVGAGMAKTFEGMQIPGPELIAGLIMEAIASDPPKAVYAAGPLSGDLLGARLSMDDEAFDQFWSQKTGLADLKV